MLLDLKMLDTHKPFLSAHQRFICNEAFFFKQIIYLAYDLFAMNQRSAVAQISVLSNWLHWFLCLKSACMIQQDANYPHGCIIHSPEHLQSMLICSRCKLRSDL